MKAEFIDSSIRRFIDFARRRNAATTALIHLSLLLFTFLALPARADYTIVDRITATGAQRIKLGYTPLCTDRIEMAVRFANTSSTMTLWCARGSSTTTASITAFLISGGLRADRNGTAGTTGAAVAAGTYYEISADYNTRLLKLNGADYVSSFGGSGTFTAGSAMEIMASHYNGIDKNLGNYASYDFYWLRIYNSEGTLVHEYLPARDNSKAAGAADEYGVYDVVAGSFKAPTGSTAFLHGDAIGAPAEVRRWNEDLGAYEYLVKVSAVAGGSISATVDGNAATITDGAFWAKQGGAVVLTPAPESGKRVYGWFGFTAGAVVDGDMKLSFTVSSPRSFSCEFADSSSTGVARVWSGAGNGLWSNAASWFPNGVPAADDDVYISAGMNPIIDASTPELGNFTMEGGTLTFTNWTTCLSAKRVSINAGTVTCAGPFNDTFDMSNRVWFAASDAFTLAAGAKIDVSKLGYGTTTNVLAGRSGMGPGKCGWSEGAAYGGETVSLRGYGDPAAPMDPGTSGGARAGDTKLEPGGGAIFIEAPNALVTVNGSMLADGTSGGDWSRGASTGGSIYLSTKRFKSSGATIRAKGGNRLARAGAASGGRIAITYDPEVQLVSDVDTSTVISAACGLLGDNYTVPAGWSQTSGSSTVHDSGRWARPGTVYFTDDRLLGTVLANGGFHGEVRLASGYEAVVDGDVNLSNGMLVFGNCLTNVTVRGNVNLASVNAYLIFGANKRLSGYTRTQLFTNDSGVAPRLEIDGDLTMTMGSRIDLNGVYTCSDGTIPAGVLDVKGSIAMSGQLYEPAKRLPGLTSIVYCVSCPTNGSGFHVFASNVVIGAEARFDGTGWGYQAVNGNSDSNGIGPGRGSRTIGAGHGGAALNSTATYGKTYDDEMRPKLPGSSGAPPNAKQLTNGGQYGATMGGGFLRLTAYDTLDVTGGIVMNGWTPTVGSDSSRCAAGAGGSLWLEAKVFNAAAGANIFARGGNSMYNGAAGGGRIALWLGAPGLDYSEIAAYSETTATDAGIPEGVLSVAGGKTISGAAGYQTAADGSIRIYNAVPKGQNLEIVYDPLDAFGTSDPEVGSHKIAEGSQTFTATDVTNDLTHVRSRCIGWTLEKFNTETGEYEEYQNGNNATCGFSMDENVYRLTWRWTKEALLTVTPQEGGSVTPSAAPKDLGWYALDSSVTLTVAPENGYVFTIWDGDVPELDSLNNPLTLVMDAAKTVQANFQAAVPGGQTFTWNGGAANGKWYDPRNWRNAGDQQGFPVAEDTAIIPADAGTVVLDLSTAPLKEVTLNSGVTLVLTNWTTAVNATTVNVRSGAKITCAGPFADRYTAAYQHIDMSNRVWIVCKDLNLDAGGVIDADGKGYGEPTTISSAAQRSYGPGGTSNRGSGGAHGGIGQRHTSDIPSYASEYDSLTAPELPGSSGGIGGTSGAADHCRAGGGVVRVEATGTVALNGTITAKGAASTSSHGSGAGAGGTIYLSAQKFTADGGVVSAAGGNGADAVSHGGGGRIALHYDTNEQDAADLVALTLDAAPGGNNGNWRDTTARPGSVWASDMTMFKFAGSAALKGALACADVREMTFPGMTVTNTYLSFVEQVTNVHVTGDLVLGGGNTRIWFGAVKPVYGSAKNYGFTSTDAIPYVLTVDGDLKVENGAALDLRPARTNGLDGVDGAYVNVAGDLEIGCDGGSVTSIVRYAAHPIVGSTVPAAARNVTVGLRGWVSANDRGWLDSRSTAAGRGPGRGQGGNTPGDWVRIIGAGHGGLGVRGGNLVSGFAHGVTYDSEVRPLMPGSSGASYWGSSTDGAGYVYLRAERKVTVAGRISADVNGAATDRSSAGSGGGILLEAHDAEVQSTACITAKGGENLVNDYASSGNKGAAGGGGRISIITGQPWSPRMKPWHYKTVEVNTVVADGAVISVQGGRSGTGGDRAGEGTFGVYNRAITGTMLILR